MTYKKESRKNTFNKAHRNIPTNTLLTIHQNLEQLYSVTYNFMDYHFPYNQSSPAEVDMVFQMKKLFLVVSNTNQLGKNLINRVSQLTMKYKDTSVYLFSDIEKRLKRYCNTPFSKKFKEFSVPYFLGVLNWIAIYSKKIYLQVDINNPISSSLENIYKSAESLYETSSKSLV